MPDTIARPNRGILVTDLLSGDGPHAKESKCLYPRWDNDKGKWILNALEDGPLGD